jgi:hypothetical protein
MMTVLVIAIRRLTTADGPLHEFEVVDQTTGIHGTLVVTAEEGRALLGDCPTSDLIDVHRARITWSPT